MNVQSKKEGHFCCTSNNTGQLTIEIQLISNIQRSSEEHSCFPRITPDATLLKRVANPQSKYITTDLSAGISFLPCQPVKFESARIFILSEYEIVY